MPIVLTDTTEIMESNPAEFALYERLDARAILASPFSPAPTGFLVIRNPSRYLERPEALYIFAYVLHRALAQQNVMEREKIIEAMNPMEPTYDVYISFFRDLEIRTAGGTLTEQIINAPKTIQLGSLCAVGHIGVDIVVGRLGFSADAPLRSKRREMHLNTPAQIIRRLKGFFHELLNVFLVNPGCTQAHLNFRSVQILRLGRTERLHIGQIGRIGRCCLFCLPQLLAHIAGEILVGSLPLVFHRVMEDNTLQAVNQRRLVHTCQLCHIRQIDAGFF